MYPEIHIPQPVVYAPAPLAQPLAVPLVVQPGVIPAVQTVQLPDGRIVTGYAIAPQQLAPVEPATVARPAVSPLAVNAVLGAGAYALSCLGLYLLAHLVEALAHLAMMLVILAAIVCGAPVALQLLRALTGGSSQPQTVINARKVRVGRIVNKGH